MPTPDRPVSESGENYLLPEDDNDEDDQERGQPNRQSFGDEKKK